jgi:hypothetical protein
MRAAPTIMAMPMMMVGTQARTVSLDEPRPRSTDTSCSFSQDRLDDLDARVDALNLRLKTMQRAVEMQTVLLQKLAEKQGLVTPKADEQD